MLNGPKLCVAWIISSKSSSSFKAAASSCAVNSKATLPKPSAQQKSPSRPSFRKSPDYPSSPPHGKCSANTFQHARKSLIINTRVFESVEDEPKIAWHLSWLSAAPELSPCGLRLPQPSPTSIRKEAFPFLLQSHQL